ncbi:hypothetical protein [Halobacterium litoreum]|uniref:ABC-2 type transport system permease protein n=1 Tax=Halobacterium litoreum TaxID=2039234 RepID=A0ABD5NDQ7_9EURY|nr:hypothetical protein [Halobacterium litoreum]UHH13768.1 hypothetical protein LT972_01935 [Halobacterium litoreum]
MPGFPDPRHAYAIAHNEIRIGWRKLADKDALQKSAVGVAALLGLAFTAAAAFGAYFGGQALVQNPESAAELVALVPAGIGTFTLFMSAYLTAIQLGDIDVRDGYLTTVPARDVVGGLLVAGFLRVAGFFAAPLLVATVAFAAGAGSPLAFPLAAVAVLALTVTAFLVGFPLGAAAAYLLGQSEFVARYKAVLGALAFVAYFALILTNTLGELFGPVVEAFRASPVAWYSDLAALTVLGDASPLKAAAVLVGSVAVSALGVAASVRVSERRWYDDGVHAETAEADSATSGRLDALLGRRTAWVARKSWLRARRAPIKLVYVSYPLFVLFTPIQSSVQAGHVTTLLPPTVALYGAWMTGALFTLNPLGDEGAVLPVSVTTGVSGREFVGGLVAASTLVGGAVTLVVTAALAILSPLSPVAVACTVAAAIVLPPLAAAVAAGVGTSFPKYEATTITRSREAVVPSMWAFGVYTLAFLVTAGVATGFQTPVVAEALADALGTGEAAVHVGSLLVGVVLAGVAAAVAARRAVREFDTYTDG